MTPLWGMIWCMSRNVPSGHWKGLGSENEMLSSDILVSWSRHHMLVAHPYRTPVKIQCYIVFESLKCLQNIHVPWAGLLTLCSGPSHIVDVWRWKKSPIAAHGQCRHLYRRQLRCSAGRVTSSWFWTFLVCLCFYANFHPLIKHGCVWWLKIPLTWSQVSHDADLSNMFEAYHIWFAKTDSLEVWTSRHYVWFHLVFTEKFADRVAEGDILIHTGIRRNVNQ